MAQNVLPNDSQVYLLIGAIQRRQGKWEESNANLEKAAQLNPNAFRTHFAAVDFLLDQAEEG